MSDKNRNIQSDKTGLGLFSRLRKWMARLAIAGLLFSNLATLVNASVHEFLFKGVEKVYQIGGTAFAERQLLKSPTKVKKRISKKAKDVSSAVAGRLVKSVALNLEALPAQTIPAIGIAASIAVVGAEIYLACENMNDMNSLLVELGADEESDKICGMKPPTPDVVLDKAKSGADDLLAGLKEIFEGIVVNVSNGAGEVTDTVANGAWSAVKYFLREF